MAPVKRKCCVPYCANVEDGNEKQFFKVGSNNEQREKWLKSIGKKSNTRLTNLYCCEDHYDLPNDAENYIRCKYEPGTKYKLRNNVLPYKKIPSKVCRVCLNVIYADEQFTYITEKSPQRIQDIIKVCLPEIDLNITSSPVACIRCFNSLESFYNTKVKALKTEVAVVKCVKSVINTSPQTMIRSNCIDLLEHCNELQKILQNVDNDEAVECIEEEKHEIQDEIKEEDIPMNYTTETSEEIKMNVPEQEIMKLQQYETLAPVELNDPTSEMNTAVEIINSDSDMISVMEQVDQNTVGSIPFGSTQEIYVTTPTSTIIVQPTTNTDEMPVYNIIYSTDGTHQEIHEFQSTT